MSLHGLPHQRIVSLGHPYNVCSVRIDYRGSVPGLRNMCCSSIKGDLRRRVDVGGELGDPGVLLAAHFTLPSGRIVSLQFLKLFQADLAFKGHDVGSAGKQQN